jgi:hypothetical protein
VKWFGKTQPSVGDQIVGDFDAQRVLDLYNFDGNCKYRMFVEERLRDERSITEKYYAAISG